MADPSARDRDQPTFDALASSWLAHLREGGTTEWPAWTETSPPPNASANPRTSGGEGLPGAAQLELLRRLNALGGLPGRTEHVLRRPGPGRGPVQLRLPWPPQHPVAPDRELLRVGAGVLADLTAQLPGPRVRRRPRLRRRSAPAFRLEGLPLTVARLRADLAAAGLVEHRDRRSWFGGRAALSGPELVLVVVGTVPAALYEAWAHRVQLGSPRPWVRFLTVWSKRHAMPPSVEVGRTAQLWADRIGAERVHVVPVDRLPEVVPQLLGHRPGSDTLTAGPQDLRPELVDVLRRVNAVLTFLPSAERDRRRAALVGLLAAEPGGGAERLRVPSGKEDWAAATGVRLDAELRRTGVVVHGTRSPLLDPDDSGSRLRQADVLAAMLRMIHSAD